MARRPFFGQSDTKIAKMDMQAATAPGRAYAQGLSKLGESIGEGIKVFTENKRKGEAAEMQIGAILEGMTDERKEELASGDSKLSKSLQQFMEGELPNSKKEALLGSLVTLDARDRLDRQEELANTIKQFQLSNMVAQKTKQANEEDALSQFSQFAMGSPEGETIEDFRNRAIEMQKSGQLSPKAFSMVANQFLSRSGKETDRDAELEMLRAKAALEGPKFTEGEIALDKEFAKEMVGFNLPDIKKGLVQLGEAATALGQSDTLTGKWVSLLPNFIGDRVNPEATQVREAVEEVVQRNLRLVLGAQFTEKEGERLISRAFNPRLSEAENKKRVERLMESIRDAAQEKINMRGHFTKYGTLRGYNFDGPSYDSIEMSAFGDVQKPKGEEGFDDPDLLEEEKRLKQLLMEREGLFSTPPAQVMDVPGAR
jgi:hypothetical protein